MLFEKESKENIVNLLNEQLNMELQASRFYLALAGWCNSNAFNGFSALFKAQAEDEQKHALSVFNFINELILDKEKVNAEIDAALKPSIKFKNLEEAFVDVVNLESDVMSHILKITFDANQSGQYMVSSFFKKLLDEQVSEQDEANNWLQRIRLCNGNCWALLQLDCEAMTKARA